MKSKHQLFFVLFLICILSFSCEQPKNEIPVVEYSTPTIKGIISLPAGSTVNPGDIYVKVIDSTGTTVKVQKANSDKTFVVQGLNADMSYSILFSSVEPEFNNRAISRDPDKSNGVGGWIHDVKPAIKEGNDIGSVKLKPLGTIRGKALIDGKAEHYDTTVYIPGTSYIAMTSADGTFAIYNVPEGTYTLRYTHDGYMPIMNEGVILTCPEDAENPEITTRDVKLISSEGTVEGVAKLGDANDSSVVSVRLENEDKSIVYSSTSSKEGNYVINNVTPGKYRIIASASGYISQSSQYFTVAPATLTKVQEDILLFGNIGTVKGSAFLSDSDVKSGLSILIKDINSENSFSTLTDDNGLFQKTLKPGEYRISANYPGYTPVSHDIVISENNTTEVNFSALLPNSGTITGFSNSAEEQVTVMAQDGTPVSTILSGLDKSYRFEKIPTGTYSVKFSKAGFASYIVKDVNVAPAGTVNVNGEALKSSYGTISGTSASENETVSLMKEGTAVDTVTTSSDRSYIFTGLGPGKYSVRFSKEGYTSYESDLISVVAGSEITINGKTLISIYGSVRGLSSSSGETVSLIKNGTVLKTVVTSQDRGYKIEMVEPGTYSVRFSKEGYTPYDSEVVTVSAGTEAIVNGNTLVSKFGTIKGVSSSSGETVYLVRNGVQIQTATTLENREYIFFGITPGEYSVRFSKSGYKAYESDVVTVVAGESYVVDGQKLVSSYGAVAGFVFLSGSDDYSGVTVTLSNSESITSSLVAITASDGSFRITDIKEAGTYLLTYSKDGYVTENTKSVDVTIGSVANAGSVTLKSTYATVKGTIQLEGASSYENVTILLKNENNQYTSTTDQKGGYVINRVLPGTYTLLASKDGYVTNSPVEVVVEPSSEMSVDVHTLSVAIRSVTGSVELELRTDHSGVLITATKINDSTKVYSAISNSEGNYTLAGMEPGEYQIVLSSNGYRTETLPTVDIVSNTTTVLSKKFIEINRGTIQGQVTLEGRTSNAGVKVELMQGTEVYETKYTDEAGSYSFYVPQGNYSGVMFSREDFNPDVDYTGIALFSDQYVSVTSKQLKATHNSISGIVDVYTGQEDVENSDVHVTIDGHNEYGEIITKADGKFAFEHLPLGNYTIRIKRQNCSDYTVNVSLAATNPVDLGVLRVFSNTGTIQGTVTLDKYTDPSGVNVYVEVDGKTLSTVTNSLGRYEIGGIPASKSFTIKYEKEGWKSESVSITNALESLEVRELGNITLIDNIAPTINSVLINNGANSTGSRQVTVDINAFDYGCGIELMQYSWSDSFDSSEWLNYNSNKQIEIPDRENGKKILMVRLKDKSGNVSDISYANINLVDQVKTYYGTLRGDDLHWKEENSPIIVSDDITVAVGTALVIDPGVDVFFDGPYSINVKGTLKAIGTESNNIHFDSSHDYVKDVLKKDGYYGCWKGIIFSDNPIDYEYDGTDISYVSGSIISNAEIFNMEEGITGSIIIKDSNIVSEKVYFCDNFYQPYSLVLFGNNITGTVYNVRISEKGLITGNQFNGTNYANSELYFDFNWNYHNFFNNYVRGYSSVCINSFYFHSNTVENCDYVRISCNVSTFCNNFINNKDEITIGSQCLPKAVLNNFIGNSGDNVISSIYGSRDYRNSMICKFNYWGPAYTNVLRNAEFYGQKNISFIRDYYDVNDINDTTGIYPEIIWSDYLSAQLDDIGYQGNNYIDFVPVCTNSVNPGAWFPVIKEGDNVEFTLSMQTGGSITKYRVAQTVKELFEEEWNTFNGECVFENSRINDEQLNGRELILLVQCMTDSGATPIRVFSVICFPPSIQECDFESHTVVTNNDPFIVTFTMDSISNEQGIQKNYYIDGSPIEAPIPNSSSIYKITIDPRAYSDGEHTLKIELIDEEVLSSETIIPFTIRRSESST